MPRPRTKNRSMRAAYDRGAVAARGGGTLAGCPYRGARKGHGGTWGAVYRNYWMRGFLDVKDAAAQTGRLL